MNSKFKMIALAAAAVSFMVACNKKSDDGAVAQQPQAPMTCVVGQMPPVGYVCMNGQLIPSAVAGTQIATLTFESTYMNGQLIVNAQGVVNTSGGYPGQNSVYGYNGPVTLSGSFQASNTICPNGTAPAGGYSLQGTANISNGVLSNVVLNAVGPATLTFQNPMLIMYNDFTRVGITSMVMLNGQYCGNVSTY